MKRGTAPNSASSQSLIGTAEAGSAVAETGAAAAAGVSVRAHRQTILASAIAAAMTLMETPMQPLSWLAFLR